MVVFCLNIEQVSGTRANASASMKVAPVSVAEERLAVVRLAPVKLALESEPEERLAAVKFWPAKFQPVRLLESRSMPCKFCAL